VVRETIFYEQTAIYLKNASSKEEVDPIFKRQGHKNMQQSARFPMFFSGNQERMLAPEACLRSASQFSSTSPVGHQETKTISSRLAQQDIDIKKLSRGIDSLQDRMLALERSMVEVRTNLRDSSMIGMQSGQDVFIDGFDDLQGAAKDVRAVNGAMEDLRSENERLRQKLRRMDPLSAGEIKDELVEAATGMMARSSSATAPEPVKKKRSHPRRKSAAPAKAITPAVADPDSSFAPNHNQDDPIQLGSLAALNEITAAMTRASSTGELQISNGSADYQKNDESPANGALYLEPGFNDGNDLLMSQQRSRRRISDEIISGDEEAGIYAQKKKLPRYGVVGMDEMMIDPALRSASVLANGQLPVSDVLSAIENPPDQKETRKIESVQHEKTSGASRYDSIHETRIREYKARDALRKRKAREISMEKKKRDGENQFKQDEKIRAREKMVKELMEREEMLEDDGDL
jgi:hypothetical protein